MIIQILLIISLACGGISLPVYAGDQQKPLEQTVEKPIEEITERDIDQLIEQYDITDKDLELPVPEKAVKRDGYNRPRRRKRPKTADQYATDVAGSAFGFAKKFQGHTTEKMLAISLIMVKKLFWLYEQYAREKQGSKYDASPFASGGNMGRWLGRNSVCGVMVGIMLMNDLNRQWKRLQKNLLDNPMGMMQLMTDPYMMNREAEQFYHSFTRAQKFLTDPDYYGRSIGFGLTCVFRLIPAILFYDWGSQQTRNGGTSRISQSMHPVVLDAIDGMLFDVVDLAAIRLWHEYGQRVPEKIQRKLYHGSLGIIRPSLPRELMHIAYKFVRFTQFKDPKRYKGMENMPTQPFAYMKQEFGHYIKRSVFTYGALTFLQFLFKNGVTNKLISVGRFFCSGLKKIRLISSNPFESKKDSPGIVRGIKMLKWFPEALGMVIEKQFSYEQVESLRTRCPNLDGYLETAASLPLEQGIMFKMMTMGSGGMRLPTDDAVDVITKAMTPKEVEKVITGALDTIILRFFLQHDSSYSVSTGLGRGMTDYFIEKGARNIGLGEHAAGKRYAEATADPVS